MGGIIATAWAVVFPFRLLCCLVFLGLLAVLVMSNPKFLIDEMAGDHLFLLGHSTDLWHVEVFDMLLMATTKNFEVSSSGRTLASSCNLDAALLQPPVRRGLIKGLLLVPVTKMTGRPLYGPECNFPIF